jgi:hypothetical protein
MRRALSAGERPVGVKFGPLAFRVKVGEQIESWGAEWHTHQANFKLDGCAIQRGSSSGCVLSARHDGQHQGQHHGLVKLYNMPVAISWLQCGGSSDVPSLPIQHRLLVFLHLLRRCYSTKSDSFVLFITQCSQLLSSFKVFFLSCCSCHTSLPYPPSST